MKFSDEQRQKISEHRKGKCLGNKHRLGKTPWNKGGHLSVDVKRKISVANTGKKYGHHTEEWKKKMSKTMTGRKVSPETILKLRKSHIGIKQSRETIEKRVSQLRGENNSSWKGDDVGYVGLHVWIARHLGRPTKCEHCGQNGLTGRTIHWASKSHEYKRDVSDWLRLCIKCHGKYDRENGLRKHFKNQ